MKNYFDPTLSVEDIIKKLNDDLATDAFSFDLKTVEVSKPILSAKYEIGNDRSDFMFLMNDEHCDTLAITLETAFKEIYPHGYIANEVVVVPTNKRINPFGLPIHLFNDMFFSKKDFKELMHSFLTFIPEFFRDVDFVLDVEFYESSCLLHGLDSEYSYCFGRLPFLAYIDFSMNRDDYVVTKICKHWHSFEKSITESIGYLMDVQAKHVNAYKSAYQINSSIKMMERSNAHTVQLEQWTLRNVEIIEDDLFDKMLLAQGRPIYKFFKNGEIEMNADLQPSIDVTAYVHPSHLISYKVLGQTQLYISESNHSLCVVPYPCVIAEIKQINSEL